MEFSLVSRGVKGFTSSATIFSATIPMPLCGDGDGSCDRRVGMTNLLNRRHIIGPDCKICSLMDYPATEVGAPPAWRPGALTGNTR